MSQSSHVPSYRKHRQSGQAVVTLPDGLGGRRDVLLGKYGTKESRVEYARVIAEWEAAGRWLPRPNAPADATVNEVLIGYWRYAEGYYRKNGQPTKQLVRVKIALKPVKELYGHTLAKDFGPLALKAVRQSMIRDDWTRGYVNSCVGCIKRAFKWAVENELVPGSCYHALQAVGGLKKGRSEARETRKITPVDNRLVEAVLPLLTPPVRAMVQVQRLAGMRPIEVVLMRPCDIERRPGKPWVYRPETHKTEHHDIERIIFLGPQAQEILQPFLDGRHPGAYLFCPREALAALRERQRANRKTKVQPSQVDRKKKRLRRQPGQRYTVDTYRQAIDQATLRAFPPPAPLAKQRGESRNDWLARLTAEQRDELQSWYRSHHWHPNQLRHAAATEIRREAGLDAARAVLGHRSSTTTEVYAEVDQAKATEVAQRLG